MAATVDKEAKSTESENESFWTGGRIAVTLIIGGLLIWWGISSWTASRVPNVAKPPSVTSKLGPGNGPAPAFVTVPTELRDATLQTIDGGSVKFSDLADKVVVVNLWAVWCGPCRMEMPELIKMSNEYKARGLVVLGIASSYNETRDQVRDFARTQNIPYQIIFDDGTLEASLVEAVHSRPVIPQSFLISRDGKIVKHFSGFNVNQTPQLMRHAIEEALGDKGKA